MGSGEVGLGREGVTWPFDGAGREHSFVLLLVCRRWLRGISSFPPNSPTADDANHFFRRALLQGQLQGFRLCFRGARRLLGQSLTSQIYANVLGRGRTLRREVK